MSNRHGDLTKECDEVQRANLNHKRDIEQLGKRTEELRKKNYDDDLKQDELEQYDRRQNLEFEGVPLTKDEEITQVTMDLVAKLNVDLEEDISIVHRLPVKHRTGRISNGSKRPTTTLRLVNRLKKNEIYENRFKARDIKEFPVNNIERLHINGNLTKRRKRLFW